MFKRFRELRAIPQVVIDDPDHGLRLAEALHKGGIDAMEVRYRSHSDSVVIKEIRKAFPDFWVGAGGILNKDLLLRGMDAHACFCLSPGVNAETIREAAKLEYQFAPGVCTPSDVENALLNGAVNLQYFPAKAAGGVETLLALIEPFDHLNVEFLPKGGITLDDASDYLRIEQVAAVSAAWIAPKDLIAGEKWETITDNARQTLSKLK